VVCGRLGETICAWCLAELPRLRGPCCARCGAPTAWPVARCLECAGRRLAFTSARSAVAYLGPVRPLVAAWKERGLRHLAEEAANVIANTVEQPSVHALAFAPADGDRSVKRGHHPAERLARELGSRWDLTVVRALGRTRAPRPQRGLTLAARRRNVAGSFVARRRPAEGRPHRRRVHDRRNGLRRLVHPPGRRCEAHRRRDVRACDPRQ